MSNPFKQEVKTRSNYRHIYDNKVEPEHIFSLENDLFPSLQTNINNENINITSSFDFKTALETEVITEKDKKKEVKPGCVEISKGMNGKIEYNYGKHTSTIKSIDEEETNYYNNNINQIMVKAIDNMKDNWSKYKKNYDEIYGEGAYNEMYYLSPIYGSEYSDSETEEETDIEEEQNEEYY